MAFVCISDLAESEGSISAPEDISPAEEAMRDEFYDWWAENDHLLSAGFAGDLLDLRSRLNAALEAANHEVEVTPEMIEAGFAAFSFDERFEGLGDAITRVYVAMEDSRRVARRSNDADSNRNRSD